MEYKRYGYDDDGNWVKDRKTRKYERSLTYRYNKALHSKRTKKENK